MIFEHVWHDIYNGILVFERINLPKTKSENENWVANQITKVTRISAFDFCGDNFRQDENYCYAFDFGNAYSHPPSNIQF